MKIDPTQELRTRKIRNM